MESKDIKIKLVNTKEDFYRLKEGWDRIVERLPYKTFFHEFMWHKSYIDIADALPIIYLTMYKLDNLIGIFPIEIYKKKVLFFKFSVLRNPDCFTEDALIRDFIFDQTYSEENILKLLMYNINRQTDLRIDCIFLDYILNTSSIYLSLKKHFVPLSFLEKDKFCYYHKLNSYDEIKNSYSKKLLRNMRKSERKLSDIGSIDYLIYRGTGEIKKALEEFIKLESIGWKGKNTKKEKGQAIRLSKDKSCFYHNLIENLSINNKCTLYSLKLAQKNISIKIVLKIGKTAFVLKTAYDENYSKYSPSVLLLDKVIEKTFDDSERKYINFLTKASWLERWGAKKYQGYKLYLFNRSIRGIFYYILFAINKKFGLTR